MIALVVVLTAKPGKEAALEDTFRQLAKNVRANESGNELYQLAKNPEKLDDYRVLEIYKDAAALAAHGADAAFQALVPQLFDCLAGDPVIEKLETV